MGKGEDVNTLENIEIVQLFSDDRLQCLQRFDYKQRLKSFMVTLITQILWMITLITHIDG